MFYIKYLVMHLVQMHAAAMRRLFYGLCVCTGDNPLTLKLMDNLPVPTQKPLIFIWASSEVPDETVCLRKVV